MKDVTADQLLHSVARMDQVAALLRRLSRNGLFDSLSSALTAAFQSEQSAGKISTEDLRHCLKVLTAQLVDDVGKRAESGLSSKPTSAASTYRSDQQQFAIDYALLDSAPATRRSSGRRKQPPQSLQCSPSHCKSSSVVYIPASANSSRPTSPIHSAAELKAISDFAFPAPSVLFTRTIRKTLEVRNLSPGPAHYSPALEHTKERHGGVTIPKGGKRYEYYVPETPGPAFYTPLPAFLAKRLRKL